MKNTVDPQVLEYIQHRILDHQGPFFVYDTHLLYNNIHHIKSLCDRYGIDVKYAMKANPHDQILKMMCDHQIWIDASSEYEVLHAKSVYPSWARIDLNSQQLPYDISHHMYDDISRVATSLHQLEMIGKNRPWSCVWIRINPWVWSAVNVKVNTWWHKSSFGIWYKYIDQAIDIADHYRLTIDTLHTHIWSWSDPEVWLSILGTMLDIGTRFDHLKYVNIWWGMKVARMPDEKYTDINHILPLLSDSISSHNIAHHKNYRLQIEPWTRFVANVWYIVAQIVDITDTGSDGYQFVKLNTGMNDIIRPTMYGARHPIYPCLAEYQDHTSYVIVWHCCESWDTITVDMDWDPLETSLPQMHIWDWLIIWWCGAYCASMSCKWYNDYPKSPEYFVK